MNNILEYNGYYGSVHYSSKDEVFHGKIIGINDLVSFEGDSAADLKAAFKEAVEDYLETCKELNKEPDKMYKGSFNIRIPSDLHRKAAIVASINNVTLNDLVKTAIDDLVKRNNRDLVH